MAAHVFGLTGGLASGKSTVGKRFREKGVPVIDADQVARDVVVPGSEGLAAVVARFGPEVLAPDGSLDRPRLGAIVFADPEKRRDLNAILHPRIGALTAARIAELTEQGASVICYEAALLVENGLADAFRPLVVVSAPEEVQVARAVSRDKLTEDQARARIRSQMPLQEKLAAADYIIDNAGAGVELERQADEVLAAIRVRLTGA